MANPSRGIISPAFVKCWTVSPVISCIIIRRPLTALASKKAAGSFKTGPCTFRSRFPLGRILPKQTFFYKLPRCRSVRGGALSYPFHRHLRQTTAFTSPLSRATAQALPPMPGCSDRPIRMQTGKSRPPGADLSLIDTFAPYYNPSNKPTGVLSDQVLIAWTESAPVGFCMSFSRILSSKIGVRRNYNRIVIIFLSNLSPIWLRKSPRKRNKDVSSSNHLFIHRK